MVFKQKQVYWQNFVQVVDAVSFCSVNGDREESLLCHMLAVGQGVNKSLTMCVGASVCRNSIYYIHHKPWTGATDFHSLIVLPTPYIQRSLAKYGKDIMELS